MWRTSAMGNDQSDFLSTPPFLLSSIWSNMGVLACPALSARGSGGGGRGLLFPLLGEIRELRLDLVGLLIGLARLDLLLLGREELVLLDVQELLVRERIEVVGIHRQGLVQRLHAPLDDGLPLVVGDERPAVVGAVPAHDPDCVPGLLAAGL